VTRRLTEAQRRALIRLEPDVVYDEAPLEIRSALRSLRLYHGDLVTSGCEETKLGRRYVGYRLTEAGIAERALIAIKALSAAP
jgi:hypothetical protein